MTINLRGPQYAPYSPADEAIAFDLFICTTNPRKREAAKMVIVKHHLRLVVKIANACKSSLPLEDRISEGTLGLMKAIETFDPMHGCRFAAYATPAIKQAIFLAARAHAVIPIPYHARPDARPTTTSMDAPIADGSWNMHDVTAAPSDVDADRRIALDQLLNRLPARHAEVLRSALAGRLHDHGALVEATRIARRILKEDEDET